MFAANPIAFLIGVASNLDQLHHVALSHGIARVRITVHTLDSKTKTVRAYRSFRVRDAAEAARYRDRWLFEIAHQPGITLSVRVRKSRTAHAHNTFRDSLEFRNRDSANSAPAEKRPMASICSEIVNRQ